MTVIDGIEIALVVLSHAETNLPGTETFAEALPGIERRNFGRARGHLLGAFDEATWRIRDAQRLR